MTARIGFATVVLIALVGSASTSLAQRQQFIRVYPHDAPDIVKPAMAGRYQPGPDFNAVARVLGVEGVVAMDVTVLPDGTVGDAMVVTRLHPDLDAAAVEAAAGWKFTPGTLAGVPVPVRVRIVMSFVVR